MSVESPIKEPESDSRERAPEKFTEAQEFILSDAGALTEAFGEEARAIGLAVHNGSKIRFENLGFRDPDAEAVVSAIAHKFREELAALSEEFEVDVSKALLSGRMLKESPEYKEISDASRTPEGILSVDLDELRRMNRIEALRERAMRDALAGAHDIADVRKFEVEFPPSEWSHKDFFEFANRYRLAGAAEDEVRIYEISTDSVFKKTPRAREFYALALIKLDKTKEALSVCNELIEEGFDNGLVRGIMGDARMCRGETPEAAEAYKTGFQENTSSFCALGWRDASVENLLDLQAKQKELGGFEDEIGRQETMIAGQTALIRLALDMEGGEASLDYWVNAGEVELALIEGATAAEIEKKLELALRHADAAFKLSNTARRFRRMEGQMKGLGNPVESIARAADMLEEAASNLQRGHEITKRRHEGVQEAERENAAVQNYLDHTIDFRAIMGSSTPTYIPGGIGRTGGRVPDIVINREDVRAFESVITELDLVDEFDPRIVKNKIEDYVRSSLGVADLQDLKSDSHERFDQTSDAMIDLAGIPPRVRKGTHSVTNISASLVTGGDCRETLYAMGALFTTQQKMHLRGLVEKAVTHLENDDHVAFEQIMGRDIDRATRYEMRGQHARVYVRGIAMRQKYDSVQGANNKDLAAEGDYSLASWRAGERLSEYELKNSLIEVGYSDGSQEIIKPGAGHENEAGRPLIPQTDDRRIASLSLITPVEEHTLSHLYDRKEKKVELADAFYDNDRENGPYSFGEGAYDFKNGYGDDNLIAAGARKLERSDGNVVEAQVYLESLPYSKTDAMRSLGEGDIPKTVRLMGRFFEVDMVEEIKKFEHNKSSFSSATKRIREWSLAAQKKS